MALSTSNLYTVRVPETNLVKTNRYFPEARAAGPGFRVFEEQKGGAAEKMQTLSAQMDELLPVAAADLAENDPAPFLADLSRKILDCRRIESQAFQVLASLGFGRPD